VNEQEQYVATLLSYKLREHGFTMIMSNDIYGTVDSTPAILLVEDTVPIAPDFKANVLKFNRNNPHPAIEEIRRRMTPYREPLRQIMKALVGS
jgi:hypothetical protein